ncbi:MAG: radical SAM protein [Planctomycetota bacterium]|nr:radical SAM protein [Planctomycetota bacterium]
MKGVRRQYLDILGDRARAGDVGSLIQHGLRWVGTALGPRAGRPLTGPALGTLVVTYRCDLRCQVCDLPARAAARRRAGHRELDTDGLMAILRDMKAIGTAGVGFTGGEPMLRSDLPELLREAHRLGLHGHLNTDGFQVAERAEALMATGVRSINLSLDGPDAATHDAARRKAGSFETVLGALRALRAARGRRSEPRITAVTVLTARNVHRAAEVVRVAREAGADRVGVIPVHDFGQGEDVPDPAAVRLALDELAQLHARGWVDNSTGYLDLLPRAFRGEPSPLFCYAPYASVVVDCYGDVFPCFPLMERNKPVGQIPLVALWRSARYAEARESLAACTACLWNCHTEMNLALPQGRLAPRSSTLEVAS